MEKQNKNAKQTNKPPPPAKHKLKQIINFICEITQSDIRDIKLAQLCRKSCLVVII